LEDRSFSVDDGQKRSPPTPFEQEDALEAIAQMGGQVARIYTLSIQNNASAPGFHVARADHVDANPTTKWSMIQDTVNPILFFNQDLLAGLDSAIAIAQRKNIRLIIPIIDRWQWWGGIEAFAALHNLPGSHFYSDARIKANYIAVFKALLVRVNSLSGISYCRDRTILAFETGNELELVDSSGPPPAEWTMSVAAYIQEIMNSSLCAAGEPASRPLLIDGSFGSVHGWSNNVLADPNIDGFTGHCKLFFFLQNNEEYSYNTHASMYSI
jgi:endo-1,4-beta-mannosidase